MSRPGVTGRKEKVDPPKPPHKALKGTKGFNDNVYGHYYEPTPPDANFEFSGSDRREHGRIPAQTVTVVGKPHRIFVPFNKQYTPVMATIPMDPIRIKAPDDSFIETYSLPKRHYRFWPPVAGAKQEVPVDKKGKDDWFGSGKLEPLDKGRQPPPPLSKSAPKPSSFSSKVPTPAPGKRSHQETLAALRQPTANKKKPAVPEKKKEPGRMTVTRIPEKAKVSIEKPDQERSKPTGNKYPLAGHSSPPAHPYSPSSPASSTGTGPMASPSSSPRPNTTVNIIMPPESKKKGPKPRAGSLEPIYASTESLGNPSSPSSGSSTQPRSSSGSGTPSPPVTRSTRPKPTITERRIIRTRSTVRTTTKLSSPRKGGR